MESKTLRVLFVGIGMSSICWYRCTLPAMYLGCDWIGVVDEPPNLKLVTGFLWDQPIMLPNFDTYDVIVLQQPRGNRWFSWIKAMQAKGKVVLYEIDDYVHGIKRVEDHDFKDGFGRDDLKRIEICMRACDGMIVSTPYLARRYRQFNRKIWVCENGLDMGRYRLTRPERGLIDGKESVTLLWSGATGHGKVIKPWLAAVNDLMSANPQACFASIGQPFADQLLHFGLERVVSVPFSAIETYPSAMMLGDIVLAPAGDGTWWRAKSELRAMEAAAIGAPVIASHHYMGVEHGVTGFKAKTAEEVRSIAQVLVDNKDLRLRIGRNAKQLAADKYDMRHRCEQWRSTITEAWESKTGEVKNGTSSIGDVPGGRAD